MPFTYNGNEPLAINYNGNPVSILIYNGVEVWSAEPNYLTFVATGDDTVTLNSHGFTETPEDLPELFYRINGGSWTAYTIDTSISLNEDDTIQWKGNNTTLSYSGMKYVNFSHSEDSSLMVSGNVMSLIDPTCRSKTISANFCFAQLFLSSRRFIFTDKFKLPAETLSEGCYYRMFSGHYGVVSVFPKLPAMSIPDNAYNGMFEHFLHDESEAVYILPALPATVVGDYAYANMFKENIASMLVQETLPAMTVGNNAYNGMYMGSSITTTPTLPLETLVTGCYSNMFKNCTGVNSVNVAFTDWGTDCTTDWLAGVSSTGQFYCSETLGTDETIERGDSYCPTNWGVDNRTALCFTCIRPASLLLYCDSFVSGTEPFHIEAKLNNGNWDEYTIDSDTFQQSYRMYPGYKLYVRGNNDIFNSNSHGRFRFGTTTDEEYLFSNQFDVSGDITSLLNKEGGVLDLSSYGDRCFRNLFDTSNNAIGKLNIRHSKDLLLPSTTLNQYCYSNMFRRQEYMLDSPELPSTTLYEYCYNYMFNGCYGLSEIKLYYTGYFSDAPYSAFLNWVSGITSEGTLYYNGEDTSRGNSAIPDYWTVESF